MKTISFTNSNGLKLVGALHSPDSRTDKVVIIAHGFTSNKDRPRHKQLAEALSAAGIAAFRIDFGGSGESEDREITIAAQVDDLQSAVAFLHAGQGFTQFGVLGESLGGITAIKAFDEHIKALVLWAPVTSAIWTSELDEEQQKSLEESGFYIRKKDGKDFRVPTEYVNERKTINQVEVLSKITIPVLIVHGTADDLIPIEESEKAVALLPPGSRLEAIQNWQHGDHKMDSDMETIIPITVDWFVSHL